MDNMSTTVTLLLNKILAFRPLATFSGKSCKDFSYLHYALEDIWDLPGHRLLTAYHHGL